jgi:hypothetical protein
MKFSPPKLKVTTDIDFEIVDLLFSYRHKFHPSSRMNIYDAFRHKFNGLDRLCPGCALVVRLE